MEDRTDRYASTIVGFLDDIGYSEPDDKVLEGHRAQVMRAVCRDTMEHFRPRLKELQITDEWLTCLARTIVRMTVFGWERLPLDVMTQLNIYFMYAISIDDPGGDAQLDPRLIQSFAADLTTGREQAHPKYRSLFAFFPDLFRCYGPISQTMMFKSNMAYMQACWIECQTFRGLPGATDYPMFMRRLNGLGEFCGAALLPAAQFDEQTQLEEMMSLIAQVEPVIILVNDLFSFYKESAAGDGCLVNNIAATGGLDLEEVLARLRRDAARAVNTLLEVFTNDFRQAVLADIVDVFVRGYVRWHLCDERYRLASLVAQCGDSDNGAKLRRHREIACRAACVDLVDFDAF
ncbi:hypothetical protein GCM10022267_39810 [Lentzea roselyniae]|uniref:Terpene synthase n=1 Tax=Lentzea roselyniae TaxID=531940 RepID=A0ABP7B6V3_9PSEU